MTRHDAEKEINELIDRLKQHRENCLLEDNTPFDAAMQNLIDNFPPFEIVPKRFPTIKMPITVKEAMEKAMQEELAQLNAESEDI